MRTTKMTPITCIKCAKIIMVRSYDVKYHSGRCGSCAAKNRATQWRKYKSDIDGVPVSKTRMYNIWSKMFRRPYARVPKVCKEWRCFDTFKKWSLAHGYRKDLTIDRINNNGDYYPDNCQWITKAENAAKDKRFFHDSEALSISSMRREMGISQSAFAELLNVSQRTVARIELVASKQKP